MSRLNISAFATRRSAVVGVAVVCGVFRILAFPAAIC
eukprot:CAMPEP_0203006226 /NCGR_PEP_ID=MMETSP1401-20130829/4215_1 /ASSEMBLY_ACC=CAM_ASM_000894 /TAXON_ID=38833 /ORGANISM="Micromonas pusilla, Strain CCAC1681" /LENGTH=36 /DNA_ID= /DNA_START= /DNA_END= /DNA_ORIENTATION=